MYLDIRQIPDTTERMIMKPLSARKSSDVNLSVTAFLLLYITSDISSPQVLEISMYVMLPVKFFQLNRNLHLII